MLDEDGAPEANDALLGGHERGFHRSAPHVEGEESAQPPGHLLARVVRVLAQLLRGNFPEDAAPAQRGAAACELPMRAEDERGAARVHLPVIDVVGQLVEVRVAALPSRRLGGHGDDAREAPALGVGLEGQLRLRIRHELLLEGERQLLVYLPGDEHLLHGI
ncbi:hypothetical protein ACLEPN_01710 [Myxococcus sp. 1LA]